MQINSLISGSRWDYVPVIGSGVAAVQLFERCLSTEVSEVGRHRYGVLAPGGIARAICLLLPVIGNIVIFVYDLVRGRAFNRLLINGLELRDLWEGFQDDEEIVKAAVMQNEEALTYASDEVQAILRQEITEAISTVQANGLALQHLEEWLKNVRSVVTAAIEQNELALQHASPSLQAILQQEITEAISTVRANGLALEHLDGWLKDVRSVVTAAVGQNELALQHARPSLQGRLRAEINQKIAVVWANGLALQNIEGWLKNVRSVVTAAVGQNELALQHASPSLQAILQQEITEAISTVRANGLALEHLDGWLKDVRSVVTAAVGQNELALQYASPSLQAGLRAEINQKIAVVQANGLALQHLDGWLKNVRSVVTAAIEQNELALQYASPSLQERLQVEIHQTIEIVRADGLVLENRKEWLKNVRSVVTAAVEQNGWALQYASDALKNDKEVVLAAVEQNGWVLQFASAERKNDREAVLEAVKQNGGTLLWASDVLKNDRDFVLEAVRLSSSVLYYANAEFRNDRDFMLEAVRQNGWALAFASAELKDDREIVCIAVMQNEEALTYASDKVQAILRQEITEAISVVRVDGLASQHLDEWLKDVRSVVTAAIEQSVWVLQYASGALRNDRDFMLEAVRKNGSALQFASDALKDDEEVVRAAIANRPAALQYASARVQGVIEKLKIRAVAMCGSH